MDYIWSPWRYAYVSGAALPGHCIFCRNAAEPRDEVNYILKRGKECYVLLNLYPYTSGHLMIAPYAHVATLSESAPSALEEMIRLAREAEQCLREVYEPKGVNIGMNVGECAGAGVAGHIHLHVVPRWPADSNFMTTIGETRVLPEAIEVTYKKLLVAFSGRS
jgi:ATP adenylyltransferase